jgi:hypothetical protein
VCDSSGLWQTTWTSQEEPIWVSSNDQTEVMLESGVERLPQLHIDQTSGD